MEGPFPNSKLVKSLLSLPLNRSNPAEVPHLYIYGHCPTDYTENTENLQCLYTENHGIQGKLQYPYRKHGQYGKPPIPIQKTRNTRKTWKPSNTHTENIYIYMDTALQTIQKTRKTFNVYTRKITEYRENSNTHTENMDNTENHQYPYRKHGIHGKHGNPLIPIRNTWRTSYIYTENTENLQYPCGVFYVYSGFSMYSVFPSFPCFPYSFR